MVDVVDDDDDEEFFVEKNFSNRLCCMVNLRNSLVMVVFVSKLEMTIIDLRLYVYVFSKDKYIYFIELVIFEKKEKKEIRKYKSLTTIIK